jgi:hypothetical protein
MKQDVVSFYNGYAHEGNARKLPLGPYEEAGKVGLTLARARDRAAELSRVYRSGVMDLRVHVARTLGRER